MFDSSAKVFEMRNLLKSVWDEKLKDSQIAVHSVNRGIQRWNANGNKQATTYIYIKLTELQNIY